MKQNLSTISVAIFMIILCVILPFSKLAAQDESSLDYIRRMAWSPNGQMLALGGYIEGQPAIQFYNSEGDFLSKIILEGNILSLAWSPDGSQLAALLGIAGSDDTIYIWDVDSKQIQATIPQEGGTSTHAIVWSPDGHLLAAVRTYLNVWDVETGEKVTTLRIDSDHVIEVTAFTWFPDGRQIATVDTDEVLRVWDITSNTVNQQRENVSIVSLGLSPDGTLLALVGGPVQIVEASNIANVVSEFQPPQDAHWYVSWAAQGDYLAVAGSRSDITVWDVKSGKNIDTIVKATPGFLEAMTFSPYGGRLVYATNRASAIYLPPVELETLPQRSYAADLLDGAVQIVVPAPSLERLQAVSEACNAPAAVKEILPISDVASQLSTFVNQLDALPENTIPAGCKADLLAVAEALQN